MHTHGLAVFRTTIRIEKLNSSKKRSRKKIFSAARTHIHKYARTGIEKQCVQRNEYYLKVQHTTAFCFVPSFYLQLFFSPFRSLRDDICAAFCLSTYYFLSVRSFLQQANVLNRLLYAACLVEYLLSPTKKKFLSSLVLWQR